jgi:hypothetical protein
VATSVSRVCSFTPLKLVDYFFPSINLKKEIPMVWLVAYNNIDNGDNSVTVWDDHAAALQDVCANIVDDINNGGYNLNDSDTLLAFQDIDLHIQAYQWQEAIDRWNEWSADADINVYWNISLETLFGTTDAAKPGAIAWPAIVIPTTAVVDEAPLTLPTGFVPVTNGSTCRGPCAQWNEYASPDRGDGTHICYSCKAMSSLCGGKIK